MFNFHFPSSLDVDGMCRLDGSIDAAALRNADLQLNAYIARDFNRRNDICAVHWRGATHPRRLGRVHVLLKFWRPLAEYGIPFAFENLAVNMSTDVTDRVMRESFNFIVEALTNYGVNRDEANDVVTSTIEAITALSARGNDLEGNTIALYDLCMASAADPELDAILNIELPAMQSSELEAYLKDKTKRLSELLVQHDTCFAPYIVSGTGGMRGDQLQQAMIAVGQKPTYNGDRAYRHMVQGSFLNGLKSIPDFLVVAHSARKAMQLKSRKVPEGDTLRRQFQFLVVDVMMNHEVADCGSQHLVPIRIINERIGKRVVGRYYQGADGCLHMFNVQDIASAVGHTLMFRSPIGCRAPVCRTCYGKLADVNHDIHIGTYANLQLTNAITQRLLSAKHLQRTDSEHMEFREEFYTYMQINVNELHVLDDADIRIRVYTVDIEGDRNINLVNTTMRFSIITSTGTEIEIDSPVPLVMDEAIWGVDFNEDYVEIDRVTYSSSDLPVFTALVNNIDISHALTVVQKLIISSSHNDFSDMFINDKNQGLLMECLEMFDSDALNFNIAAVHVEILMSQLMFTPTDPPYKLNLADYENKPGFPPYQLMGVCQAITRGPSPIRAVLFERIKQTLQNPDMYLTAGRDGSILDDIYTSGARPPL